MAHRTATTSVTAAAAASPPDIATMRETVDRLLDPDADPGTLPPSEAELEMLTATVREHLELLLPKVMQRAEELPRQSIPRYCALACAGEARERLRAEPSRRFGGPPGHARRLARTLNALVDHYERMAPQ